MWIRFPAFRKAFDEIDDSTKINGKYPESFLGTNSIKEDGLNNVNNSKKHKYL
jgi:hypothetical protein